MDHKKNPESAGGSIKKTGGAPLPPNTSPNLSQNKTDSEASRNIEELAVPVSPGFHLTIKTLVAGITALVGATYAVIAFVQVDPLEKKVSDLKDSVVALAQDKTTLESQFSKLQNDYKRVVESTTRPVLLGPEDHTSLLGGQLVFEWDYKDSGNVSSYVIEIRDILSPDKPKLISVARPETKRQFYDLGGEMNGEFLWRACPGSLVNGELVVQGPWSETSDFSMYANDLERIKRTGKLRVGTTPSAYDSFVASDENGNLEGFEVDLVNWLNNDISARLGIKPMTSVEIIQIPWNRLLNAVDDGEVDIAVRSITKSTSREREFRNIRFSVGYLTNHQIIVQRTPLGEFPTALNGAVVGVKAGTINEKAARYLVEKFHWKVDSSYVNYGDIYEALQAGKLDFALLDSVLARKFTPNRIVQFGPELDNYLSEFYRKQLGTETEQYAVAIHAPDADNALESTINTSLLSEAGKAAIHSSMKKNGL